MKRLLSKGFFWTPTRIIVTGFACVILTGTILLTLSISSADGTSAPLMQSLFTSVSATCVTGLVVVDTATTWSIFGQAVILCMIQLGGIGFMIFGVMFALLFKRTVTPRNRMIIAQSLNLGRFDGLVRISRRIIVGTFAFELIGAVILSLRFIPIFGFADGIWKSVFHSVSAFCNAGFDILGAYSGEFSSLTAFSRDPVVNITLAGLIIIGGIGFVIWDDLFEHFKSRRKLSSYTKFVISVSLALIFFGTIVILFSEWNNVNTIGNFSISEKLLASFFQSVSPRTAGFNTIDLASMHSITKLMMIFLMFIGGASASTAGGIKIATFGLIFCSAAGVLRGKSRVTVFNHSVKTEDVLRAYSLTLLQLVTTLVAAGIVIMGNVPVMDAMFEAFSASGTVGLSLSLTPSLGILQQVALVLLMFFGRVGILTVSYAIAGRMKNFETIHAEANMLVG